MKSKTLLLCLAVTVVGLLAMPTTLSLISGQHTFYGGSSYSGTGNDVKCKNCHNNVYDELNTGGGDPRPHSGTFFLDCKGCHATGNLSELGFLPAVGITLDDWGMSSTTNDLNGSHAAITLQCTFCHDMIATNITDPDEAHKPLYEEALTETLLQGANEACTVCHTAAGSGNLNMSSKKLNINVTQDESKNYIVNYSVQ